MGGIIILLGILIPTLLLANLDKVYIRLMILCTVWLGAIGFIDDYLKIRAKQIAQSKGLVYKKSDSDGLAGRFKIFGQVILGIIVGTTLYFTQSVTVQREVYGANKEEIRNEIAEMKGGNKWIGDSVILRTVNGVPHKFVNVKSVITTIPFVKKQLIFFHIPLLLIN